MNPRDSFLPERWRRLNDRLSEAKEHLARIAPLQALDETSVLAKRAERFARRRAENPAPGEEISFITFKLSGEVFGIESEFLDEAGALKGFTPLPSTPAFIAGVIALHGAIVSLVDLRQFWKLASAPLTDMNKVLIVSGAGNRFGILADDVLGMLSAPKDQLLPPPREDFRGSFIRWISPDRTAILDLPKLLNDPEMKIDYERDLAPQQ